MYMYGLTSHPKNQSIMDKDNATDHANHFL